MYWISYSAHGSKPDTEISLAAQRVVKILVNDGDEQTPFYVHAHLLTANSALFAKKIKCDDDLETVHKPLIIDDVSSDTFDSFTRWLCKIEPPMAGVEVDRDALDVSTDVVVVPEEAVTFDGTGSTDGDTTVVRRENKWWITFSNS